MKEIKGLLWLRGVQLRANSEFLMMVALPYAIAALYFYLFKDSDASPLMIVELIMPMACGLTSGMLVSMVAAEEKEKANSQELMFAGVSVSQYLLSLVFYPLLLTLLAIVIIPMMVGATSLPLAYYPVAMLTTLTMIALNLAIASITQTVNQTQMIAMPLFFVIYFIPLLDNIKENLDILVDYSLMGL